MTSERDLAQLSAYLDGELSPAERAQVEQRLASDPASRSALQALERTQSLIATTMEDVDLTAAVQVRVNAIEPEASASSQGYLVPGIAAAALILVVIAGLSWMGSRDEAPAEPIAAAPQEAAPQIDEPPPPTVPEPRPAPTAPAPAPSETEPVPAAVMADSPPVDAFFELPEANVSYVLLAVDTTVRPPLAYVRPGRDDSVERIAEGDAMPDGTPLAWAGAAGVILGSPGEWRRVDAPGESDDTLTGWWQFTFYRNNRHEETAVLRITEAPDGRFLLHFTDVDLQGQRDGSRIEMTPPPPGDGANWRGSVTHGSSRIEIAGMAGDDSHSIWAERLTALAHAQHAYRESQRQRAVQVADSLLHELNELLWREETMPGDADALTALLAGRSQEKADFLARTMVYYDPFDPISLPPASVPSVPAEAAGDPDALERFELEMSAVYGLDAPVSLPIVELAHEENGDRVGLSLSPSGHLSLWQRRSMQAAVQDSSALSVRSAANLRRLGQGIQTFQREYDGYTPAGWWGLYAHLGSARELEFTHPGDEPGTLSYELLLPATDITAYLESLLEPDALESREELQRLRADLPLIAESRPFGEPPGRHVVFADGHTDWMNEQDYQQLLREWLR